MLRFGIGISSCRVYRDDVLTFVNYTDTELPTLQANIYATAISQLIVS